MAPVYATHPSKKAKQDDSIMCTNNSSIVSKRSTESLYYPQPHFFRYVVKKHQRRSPLINRGYWLRMYAVEQVVQYFLQHETRKKKVILNLGCGYDPLPFRYLSQKPALCQNVLFIDVDYPTLISEKTEAIRSNPQLRDLLTRIIHGDTGIRLQSEQYYAVGCDLADIAGLDELLKNEIDLSQCLVLCIAEVSITYMSIEAANNIICWAALQNDVRFCLLEQYLPDGPDHPFAKKMLEHFQNLQTPLRSILSYPRLEDQVRRFQQHGWSSVHARNLWNLWSDPAFLSPKQRIALDDIEPFDEWEEFVLFASHYFLLVATTGQGAIHGGNSSEMRIPFLQNLPASPAFNAYHADLETVQAHRTVVSPPLRRRYGALFQISHNAMGYHGGLDSKSRTDNTDLFSIKLSACPNTQRVANSNLASENGPVSAFQRESRMCHTITNITQTRSLLVGGRGSPDRALKDCWEFQNGWTRVVDLPFPLYRHCAARVTFDLCGQTFHGLLLFGGKTLGGQVSDKWLLWYGSFGWSEVKVFGDTSLGSFGATMTHTGLKEGIMLGGMAADGTILCTMWQWALVVEDASFHLELRKCAPLIAAGDVEITGSEPPGRLSSCVTEATLGRFGATVVQTPRGLFIIGGVSNHLAQNTEVAHLLAVTEAMRQWRVAFVGLECLDTDVQRPLFVGHTAIVCHDFIVIAGGGAVCFSFGNQWNKEMITIVKDSRQNTPIIRRLEEEIEPFKAYLSSARSISRSEFSCSLTKLQAMPRLSIASDVDFQHVLKRGRPAVMGGMNLGKCTEHWTLEQLRSSIGADREVVVHEATGEHMDFQRKNFKYVKKLLGNFLNEIAAGSRQYLRSLAVDQPSTKPADISVDFPEIAHDLELPSQLDFARQNMHSSVLRISGPVNMWLHYDVMANILCQIHGTKRLLLYPPSNVSSFSIPAGASSSSINCFDPNLAEKESLSSTQPLLALLEPGDVLYIPPLWLHTASPVDNVSISVNVFFRNLESGYAAGKDIYGNRDVQAYEKGRKDIEKIARSFNTLPQEMGRFYLERLADELKEKALHHCPS